MSIKSTILLFIFWGATSVNGQYAPTQNYLVDSLNIEGQVRKSSNMKTSTVILGGVEGFPVHAFFEAKLKQRLAK